MAEFVLDTSGAVEAPSRVFPGTNAWWRWSDLSPFCQGYVEALFRSGPVSDRERLSFVEHGYGFRNLSPAALELILKDCEAWRARWEHNRAWTTVTAEQGRKFWVGRNTPGWDWPRDFPPLRPALSDEGKVDLQPE